MRTREELGLSDQRYRSLVEQVPAVSYVARWEPGSPFTYVSPQIEELLGFPAERWVAEPELWAERLHPDDREARPAARSCARSNAQIALDREYRLIAADGSVVWVWERDTIVYDSDGEPSHTEGVIVDITERKLTEARAQHYLDVAGTILLVLGIDQTVELLNRHGRELLGYEDGELIGRDWYELVVPEEDRETAGENFQRVLRAEEEFTYHQGDVVTRSGERRTIAWRNTLLRDVSGYVVGILVLGRGHHRAPARGGGDLPARLLRPADRAAQPRPARGRAAPLREPLRALGPRRRAAARRPRQLQARQRLVRPRGRRPPAAADRGAAARARGRAACSRASAATSS